MKVGTRLAIGAVLVASGVAMAGAALWGKGSDVRQVADVLAAPADHVHGRWTLLGVPEPPQVPVTTASGPSLVENGVAVTTTTTVTAWTRGGITYHSTHILNATPDATGTHFSFRNETRVAGHPQLAFPPVVASWEMPGRAFGVRGFQVDSSTPPAVWAVYAGPFKEPLQPKPSQFVGHLAGTVGGQPLPDGALVYLVESYTAGCSSKFIPPAEQARLAQNGTMASA
ncbi:MAG: hypothetical protein ACYDBQ_01435 [Thermoplasmatota archaeon]